MNDIKIIRMSGDISVACERSTIVASFDARVGDFKIHNAQIRKDHARDDHLFVSLPGRKTGGISMAYGDLRSALCDAALAHYREHFHV